MTKKTFSFSSANVACHFNADFLYLHKLAPQHNSIIITDENIYAKHKKKFKGYRTIVISPGEENKTQSTVDSIIPQLIEAGADRASTLVGIGGGVVTDITGYVAGIYMRGINFGFVPTSILAMVDAAVGGKNGIDVGLYKNIVGLTRQPSFILYDYSFLRTLPKEEWVNGFAEIIKHACIQDPAMFKALEESSINSLRKDPPALAKLITRNVLLKMKVVQADEFETGDRKILNFGHTIGHAIENLYSIPHGHAISIGMGVACCISQKVNGFKDTGRVLTLLKQYGLPPLFAYHTDAVIRIIQKDKKKEGDILNYIVLDKIGKASTLPLSIHQIKELL